MQNPYAMNGPDWMGQAPSPYQQAMMGNGAPQMAPNDTSFRDMAMRQGSQMSAQPGAARGQTPAMFDQKAMADALRKQGGISGIAGKIGNAVNPYLPGTQQATADQFGTNPYSQQNLMLAQQNQGF